LRGCCCIDQWKNTLRMLCFFLLFWFFGLMNS
jgi:hypothetical protein